MSDNSKKAEELKEQGNQAFAVKNYEKAISLYTEAIKLDPNNHVFFSNRSASYGGQSKWKLAEEDAKECIRLEPSFVKGYYRLATAQVELGDYDGAAATVRQGLTVDPNNPQLMKQLRAIKKAAKEKASGVGASATKTPRALDAATTRELQDLQLQFAQTTQEYNVVQASVVRTQREYKVHEITKAELEKLPSDANCYRSIGKMFLRSSRDDVMGHLTASMEDQKKKETDMAQKMEYLERRMKSQRQNIDDLTSQ